MGRSLTSNTDGDLVVINIELSSCLYYLELSNHHQHCLSSFNQVCVAGKEDSTAVRAVLSETVALSAKFLEPILNPWGWSSYGADVGLIEAYSIVAIPGQSVHKGAKDIA
jgi:hypothetical protein